MRKHLTKILFHFLSLFMIVLYVVSTMGLGVHECTAEGTTDVVLLFGETPCEYVHSHRLKDGSILTHSHSSIACSCGKEHSNVDFACDVDHNHSLVHDLDCCKTTVYSSNPDQQVKHVSISFDAPVVGIACVQSSLTDISFNRVASSALAWLCRCNLFKDTECDQSFLSVFRV